MLQTSKALAELIYTQVEAHLIRGIQLSLTLSYIQISVIQIHRELLGI